MFNRIPNKIPRSNPMLGGYAENEIARVTLPTTNCRIVLENGAPQVEIYSRIQSRWLRVENSHQADLLSAALGGFADDFFRSRTNLYTQEPQND